MIKWAVDNGNVEVSRMKINKEIWRIGIDIDGTVTDPATFIPFLNEAFNKKLLFSEITQYDLAPLYGITSEQFYHWFRQNDGRVYQEARVAPQAKEVLDHLYVNNQLIYISARDEKHAKLTSNWFEQNEIPYHHIELLGSHNKIEYSKQNEIQLFLEDKMDNANELAEELLIPIILFDTPYNQGSLHQHVQRVHSWPEAQQFIQTLKG